MSASSWLKAKIVKTIALHMLRRESLHTPWLQRDGMGYQLARCYLLSHYQKQQAKCSRHGSWEEGKTVRKARQGLAWQSRSRRIKKRKLYTVRRGLWLVMDRPKRGLVEGAGAGVGEGGVGRSRSRRAVQG